MKPKYFSMNTSSSLPTSPDVDLAPPLAILNPPILATSTPDLDASNRRQTAGGTICATLEPFVPSTIRERTDPSPLSGLPETSATLESNNQKNSWTTVNRRTTTRRKRDERRIRQLEAYNTLFHNPEPYFDRFYLIKFPVQNISTDLNVIKAESDIRAAIGTPRKILKANRNSLLLETCNKTQSDKMLVVRTLADMPVVVSSFSKLNTERGIVRSKAMGQCTIDELLDCLSDQNVIDIQRMKTRKDGELVEIDTYILTFRATTLPKVIKLSAWHTELVDEFVERPRQCFKCQKFGHVAKYCRLDTDVCGNCGEQGHKRETCSSETKCFHCQAGHRSTDKRCPKYLLECEILRTQHKEKTSRIVATDLVLSRNPESSYLFDSTPVGARLTSANAEPLSYSAATRPIATATKASARADTSQRTPITPQTSVSSVSSNGVTLESVSVRSPVKEPSISGGLKTVTASVTVHKPPRVAEQAKVNPPVAPGTIRDRPLAPKKTEQNSTASAENLDTKRPQSSVLPSEPTRSGKSSMSTPKYTFKRLPDVNQSDSKRSDSSQSKRKISPQRESTNKQKPRTDPAPAKKPHTSNAPKPDSQSTNRIPVLGS